MTVTGTQQRDFGTFTIPSGWDNFYLGGCGLGPLCGCGDGWVDDVYLLSTSVSYDISLSYDVYCQNYIDQGYWKFWIEPIYTSTGRIAGFKVMKQVLKNMYMMVCGSSPNSYWGVRSYGTLTVTGGNAVNVDIKGNGWCSEYESGWAYISCSQLGIVNAMVDVGGYCNYGGGKTSLGVKSVSHRSLTFDVDIYMHRDSNCCGYVHPGPGPPTSIQGIYVSCNKSGFYHPSTGDPTLTWKNCEGDPTHGIVGIDSSSTYEASIVVCDRAKSISIKWYRRLPDAIPAPEGWWLYPNYQHHFYLPYNEAHSITEYLMGYEFVRQDSFSNLKCSGYHYNNFVTGAVTVGDPYHTITDGNSTVWGSFQTPQVLPGDDHEYYRHITVAISSDGIPVEQFSAAEYYIYNK